MVWLIIAGVLFFLLASYFLLVGTDWRFDVLLGFWVTVGLTILIIWIFVYGLNEVLVR